jgi:hypothetical protein
VVRINACSDGIFCQALRSTSRPVASRTSTERERLRESRREQRIEPRRVVSGGLRVSVKHLAKLIANRLHRCAGDIGLGKFGKTVGDDAAHQAGGIRKIARKFIRVSRLRRISHGKRRERSDQSGDIASPDQTVGAGV